MKFSPEQRFRQVFAPMLRSTQVSIKSLEEQAKLRISGRLAADVLDMIGEHVVPGVSTDDLDRICHDYIVKVQHTIPANVGYRGFPKTVCTSVNHVVCHGIPNERVLKSGDLLNIVQERLPEYDLTGAPDNTWTMAMKPSILSDLRSKAVTQAIDTIRNRIDALGVSEPTIQEHGLGQYQILVQLPGIDDPGRVKDIMQSTAMLEIKQQMGGPYPSEQAALQDKGGVLPADAILLPGHSMPGAEASGEGQAYYLVSRVSAVSGSNGCADQMNGMRSAESLTAWYVMTTAPVLVTRASLVRRYGNRRPSHVVTTACPSSVVSMSISGTCAQTSPWSGSSTPPHPRTQPGMRHAPTVGKHSSKPPLSAVSP